MSPKRKRFERPPAEVPRPSPHRPADTALAQHDRDDGASRGNFRGRGGRGGYGRRESFHGYGGAAAYPQSPPNLQHQYNHHTQNFSPAASPSRGLDAPLQTPPVHATKPPDAPSSPMSTRLAPVSSRPAVESARHASSQANPGEGEAQTNLTSDTLARYHYENLSDEMIRAWAERGRHEIIRHGIQSREDVDITELSTLFQEFIHAVVESRLEAADAGPCVKDILGTETTEDMSDMDTFAPHTLFLDTLSIVMDNDVAFSPALRQFLMATGVSPALMREILDSSLLQQLGLIRDNFAKIGVRQATNLLYRQANYNLLREESEGYSKLITELFSTNSIPPPSPGNTFEKVKALIGTFDLDVGRALDVTFDVAAAVLIKQYKFFVKFLRVSSWWPTSIVNDGSPFLGGLPVWALPDHPDWDTTEAEEALTAQRKLDRDVAFWARARDVHSAAFFELGGRRAPQDLLQEDQSAKEGGGEGATSDWRHDWIVATRTLPSPGNMVAAQLLGFKLRFYQSPIREAEDVLPANLLYLSALLIKIGFISLIDLYPHLYPPDEDMEQVRERETEKLEKEEREARGGASNALLMAGALPQDDTPMAPTAMSRREASKKPESEQKKAPAGHDTDKEALPEPLNQKIPLLVQLLTIGAIPESLLILGRFPWILEVNAEVLGRIHRILHVCVDKVFRDSQPCTMQEEQSVISSVKQVPAVDQTGVPKGTVRRTYLATKKIWRWPYPDKLDVNECQNYCFFWDEWADNVPVCQTVEDLFTLSNTLLNLSGVNVGKDEALLVKLARIGAKSLSDDPSDSNRSRWDDFIRRILLPALSHTKTNPSAVNAVWDLVKQYPLLTRYDMYAEWFEGPTSRLPSMRTAFARSTADTRATMKRVSLTNLSEMAKRLSKTSYSSPGIVFKVAFEQLEVYANLIEAFVECAKYFTNLSYDVLVWSLLNSLGKARSRTQEDHALTTSKWLQALSRFSGKVFRRYSVLDPTPVLRYVYEQLFHGNATDLIILKEFVTSMGGIVDAVDFTDYQTLSMAGGFWLQRHTLIRAHDKRLENARSSARLMQSLLDSGLAAWLLLNLAQFRQNAIHKIPEDEAHIKYLSSLVDDSHQVLILFMDYLWSNLDPAAFDAIIPPIPKLMSTFGLDTDLAFLLGRPSLAHRMFPWKDVRGKAPERSQRADRDGDVSMSEPKDTSAESNGKSQQGPAEKEENQVGAASPPSSHDPAHAKSPQKPDDSSLSHTVFAALAPIEEAARAAVEAEVWEKITPELYATFWALQLGDICFPEDIYVNERKKAMDEWQALSNDRSDMSRKGLDRKAERKKELMDLQGYLLDELSEHGLRKAKWKYYLTKKFQQCFPDPAINPDDLSDVLLGHCFLPRMRLCRADAEYTYLFIKALHEWNIPVFKFMSLLDRLFQVNRLRVIIFSCTVREAECLGHFLRCVLRDLDRWHRNEPLSYEKDVKNPKGVVRVGTYYKEARGPSDQPRLGFSLTLNENGKPETFVEHAKFRDMLFGWHKNLNTALKNCLAGSEWMQIRNAITVLNAVVDFFPAVDFMATQFVAQLQKIAQRESAAKEDPESEEGGRVDLAVAAQGAMSELQRRKSKWVMVQAFRSPSAGEGQAEAEKATGSVLRPTAPNFTPQDTRGSTKPPSTDKEEEDGEVRDAGDVKVRAKAGDAGDNLPPKPSEPNKVLSSKQEDISETSRSSTPRNGNGPVRSDVRVRTLPDRPPGHNLPNRPDVPIPGHAAPERYHQSRTMELRERKEMREARGMRNGQDLGETREGKDPRDAGEVHSSKKSQESRSTEQSRPTRPTDPEDDRANSHGNEASRLELPPRPIPMSTQERERQHREARFGRVSDNQAAAPHASAPLSSHQSPPMPQRLPMPDRAPVPNQDGPDNQLRSRRQVDTANPDVAQSEPPPPTSGDRSGDVGTSHNQTPQESIRERATVGQAPRRAGPADEDSAVRTASPHYQASRTPNRAPVEVLSSGRAYRTADRDSERSREHASFNRDDARGQDFDPRPPHEDHSYGRLNAGPSRPDAPYAPRGRGRGLGRGGYGMHAPGPSWHDSRFGGPETQRSSSLEGLPPPGSGYGRGRRTGGFEHSGGPPSSLPDATAGRAGRSHAGSEQQSQPVGTGPSPGMHPDRLAQMGPSLPSPPASSSGQPGPSSGRPAQVAERFGPGPRQSRPGNVASSSTDTGVSGGAAPPYDRPGGTGGRRQLGGINSALQQAQIAPEAGRNGLPRPAPPRMMLGNTDAQILTGGSPASTPGQERQDVSWHDSSFRSSSMSDNGPPRRDYRGERDAQSDRVIRSSQRGSRERERERERIEPDQSPRGTARFGQGKEHHDYGERRSFASADGGSREWDARRPPAGRELMSRSFMGPPGSDAREAGPGRDGQSRAGPGGYNQGSRRPESYASWSGGDGGRGRRGGLRDAVHRGPEDRREMREPRDDRGYKRRSEEGVDLMASDRDKRPRHS